MHQAGIERVHVLIKIMTRAYKINVRMTPTDNSPAIYGWEQGDPNLQVPAGTAEDFFRP